MMSKGYSEGLWERKGSGKYNYIIISKRFLKCSEKMSVEANSSLHSMEENWAGVPL